MDINLSQLGKLVEKCKASGVSKISLSDKGVMVSFHNKDSFEPMVVSAPAVKSNPTQGEFKETKSSEAVGEIPFPLGNEVGPDEDDMLHLTDPVKWMEKEMGNEADSAGEAVGGDELEGNYDV